MRKGKDKNLHQCSQLLKNCRKVPAHSVIIQTKFIIPINFAMNVATKKRVVNLVPSANIAHAV